MKSLFKKSVSLIAATAALLSTVGYYPAYAENAAPQTEEFVEDYISTSLPNRLYENNHSFSENYYVSLPVEYSFYDTGEVKGNYYFVFENDTIIGKMRTYSYGENDYVVFDEDIPEELQRMYDNNDNMAITVEGDYTFFVSENNGTASDSADEGITFDKPLELPNVIVKAQEVDYSAMTPLLRSTGLGQYIISGIRHQENGSADGVYGLCWEACLAMKANYLKNLSLTPTQIYNEVKKAYPQVTNPYDIKMSMVEAMYRKYGLSDTYYEDQIFDVMTLLTQLRNNNPIEMIVNDLNQTTLFHSILLHGIYIYNDKTEFSILDPDVDGVLVTIYDTPNNVPDNFIYNSGTHQYKWVETRY